MGQREGGVRRVVMGRKEGKVEGGGEIGHGEGRLGWVGRDWKGTGRRRN